MGITGPEAPVPEQDAHALAWVTPLTFRIAEVPRLTDVVCRCGTRLPTGSMSLEAYPNSISLRPIFADRPFCSIGCLRAFVRESIEMLDGAIHPAQLSVCSDLRELIVDLEEVWVGLERAYPAESRAS